MNESIQNKFNLYMMAPKRVELELSTLAFYVSTKQYYAPLINYTKCPIIWEHYFKMLILINKLLQDNSINKDILGDVLSKMKVYTKRLG